MVSLRVLPLLFSFAIASVFSSPASAIAPAKPKRTVVVAPFATGSSAEYQWIGSALSESLAARLLASGEANVFSHRQWAAVLRARDIAAMSGTSREEAIAIAKQLGADEVVVGSFRAEWPFVAITAERLETSSGKALATASHEGTLDALLKAEADVAKQLYKDGFKKAAAGKGPASSVMAWRDLTLCRDDLSMQSLSPRAKLWLPKGAAEQALKHCDAAVKADRNLNEAAAFAALARYALGEKRAVKDAIFAAGHQKSSGWADLVAFYVTRHLGDRANARLDIERAIKRSPGFLHARTTLGEALLDDGEIDAAKKVFEESLAVAPNQPWALVHLAKIQGKKGDVDGAIATTDRALALVPDDPVILMEKASRQIDGKRWKDAEATLRLAMEKDPRLAAAYLRLGFIYLETDQRALAGPILKKAIYEADRESEKRVRAFAFFDLAKLAAREGRTDDAFAEMAKAKGAGLNDRAMYENDADLGALRGDPRFSALFQAAP